MCLISKTYFRRHDHSRNLSFFQGADKKQNNGGIFPVHISWLLLLEKVPVDGCIKTRFLCALAPTAQISIQSA